MTNEESNVDEPAAAARKAFDAARTTVAGARKIASLCAAALGIVWLSGLEPTLQSALKQERSFRELNSVRQEAERKIIAVYTGLVSEQTEVDRLKKLNQKEESLERGSKESLEYKIEEASSKLGETEKKLRAEEMADSLWKEAGLLSYKLSLLKADREKLKNLPALENQLAESKEKSKAWGPDILKAYESARAEFRLQSHEVDFELLGFKLKSPVLAAPILSSILLSGLLGYLIFVRERVLLLGRRGVQILGAAHSLNAETISDIAGTLPPWTARELLPAFVTENETADASLSEEQAWISQVFSSKQARLASNALSYMIPLTALLLQLRVTWIGLELTRHLGSNRTRAMASLVLIIAAAVGCWLAQRWFISGDTAGGDHRPSDTKNWVPFWLAATFIVVIGAAVVAWSYPVAAIKSGLAFQRVWWLLWLLIAFWITARIYLPKSGAFAPGSGRLITRRNALVLILGLVLIVAVRQGQKLGRHPRFRSRHRRNRGTRRWLSASGAGFYATARSPSAYKQVPLDDRQRAFNHSKADQTTPAEMLNSQYGRPRIIISEVPNDSKLPIVLHYVDDQKKVWRGGRLPRGPLKKFRIFDLASERLPSELLPSVSNSHDEQSETTTEELPFPYSNFNPPPSVPLISIGLIRFRRFDTAGPRVHLASASWAFEQAAIAELKKKRLGRKQIEEVCKLLVFAINHDIAFKKYTSRPPSYRLYDLLAGVCVRFNQDAYFGELLRLISVAEQKALFKTRLDKWNDPMGSWRKRWRNRKRRLRWFSSSGGVLF